MVTSSSRSWPWWLWTEHGVLLGFMGYSAWGVWRRRCQAKADAPQGSLAKPASASAQQPLATTSTATAKASVDAPLLPDSASALEALPGIVLESLERIKQLAGPREVLSWPDAAEAPGASMDAAALAEGEASTYRDGRGAIYKFKLAEGVFVNMYTTKAGYRRSGDLHDCNQYDVVLRGRTRLRMIEPHSGREVVREYGPNDFIVIPARTPHMFEFLEDNCLLEWWDADFKAWYYKPYRTVIEQGLPLQATEGRDFSVPLPGATSRP